MFFGVRYTMKEHGELCEQCVKGISIHYSNRVLINLSHSFLNGVILRFLRRKIGFIRQKKIKEKAPRGLLFDLLINHNENAVGISHITSPPLIN